MSGSFENLEKKIKQVTCCVTNQHNIYYREFIHTKNHKNEDEVQIMGL